MWYIPRYGTHGRRTGCSRSTWMTTSPSTRACLMTGIPTVNRSPLFLYELLASACIAGFAAYDLKKRRVPDLALLLFLPFALMAPMIRTRPSWSGSLLLYRSLCSLARAATGFLILLAAAMSSKKGASIGGRGYQVGRDHGLYLWPLPYAGRPAHCLRPCGLYLPGNRTEKGDAFPSLCAVPDGREPGRHFNCNPMTASAIPDRQMPHFKRQE